MKKISPLLRREMLYFIIKIENEYLKPIALDMHFHLCITWLRQLTHQSPNISQKYFDQLYRLTVNFMSNPNI